MRRIAFLGLLPAVVLVACSRRSPAPTCFGMLATENSPSTRTLFESKRCQGGGVTWAGVLRVLVERRGVSTWPQTQAPGWAGEARVLSWRGKPVRFAIDDEGSSVRFCTDSDAFADEIRSDMKRLNLDRAELERALKEANPLDVECFPDAGADDDLMK